MHACAEQCTSKNTANHCKYKKNPVSLGYRVSFALARKEGFEPKVKTARPLEYGDYFESFVISFVFAGFAADIFSAVR